MTRPIVIVEDDEEDCEMLLSVFRDLSVPHEFRCFSSPIPALDYLRTTTEVPFLIISDINMPVMNGLAFKRMINDDPMISKKHIPFVFLSTASASVTMKAAFLLSIQGYFRKPDNVKSLRGTAKAIVEYWKQSIFHLQADFTANLNFRPDAPANP